MSKKSIEDRFSIDIDKYIDGIEEKEKIMESEEYYELLELGKYLANKDFSKNSNKKEVFDNIIKNINEYREEVIMKNSRKSKHFIGKVASFALICALGFSIMQTSFAQEVVEKIVKTISVGHYITIYSADGIEISDIDGATAEIITIDREEYLVVRDSSKLNDYTCFNVILPSYLPEGYEFDRAEFYKGEEDTVKDSKCIELYFANKKTGNSMYMGQSFADEETAYGLMTEEKIEEVKINGVDAVMIGNSGIDWEANGVLYSILGIDQVTKSELIKIAESIK